MEPWQITRQVDVQINMQEGMTIHIVKIEHVDQIISNTYLLLYPSTVPSHLSKSGYLGALTYISGLVVLTAGHTLAVGPSEEQTHQLLFN